MQKNTTTILGIASAVFGLLLFLVSVTGIFWNPTPVNDPGMLSTTMVFVLFGVLAFFLGKRLPASQ